MLNNLPLAMILAQRAMETEARSAQPGAPVVTETPRSAAHARTTRTRTALASRLARVAEFVAPGNAAPSHQTASSR